MWKAAAAANASSGDYTPGLLGIVVYISPYSPSFHTHVTMNELHRSAPVTGHTLASRQVALEDHVLRAAGYERGSRPAGHEPLLYFTPANSEAPGAPPFATGAFWNTVSSIGARWVCSFQWPFDLFPTAVLPLAAPSAGPERRETTMEAGPPGPDRAHGGRSAPYLSISPPRPPALFPLDADSSIRQPGLVRVHVTADTLLRIEPSTRITLDVHLNSEGVVLDRRGVPSPSTRSFLRSLEVAVFEELCGRSGTVPAAPAPRGRFTPPATTWAFLRAATTRGVSCRYRLCWPVRMDPLDLPTGTPGAHTEMNPPPTSPAQDAAALPGDAPPAAA